MGLITFPNELREFTNVAIEYYPIQDVDRLTLGKYGVYSVGYGFFMVDLSVKSFQTGVSEREKAKLARRFFSQFADFANYCDIPFCGTFDIDPTPNETTGEFSVYETLPASIANIGITSILRSGGKNYLNLSAAQPDIDEGMFVKATYNGTPRIMEIEEKVTNRRILLKPDLPLDTSATLQKADTIRISNRDPRTLRNYIAHRIFPTNYPERRLLGQERVA